MIHRNVGGIDRAVRLALGVTLLGTGIGFLLVSHAYGWTLTIFGAFVLASGVLGFCPPYVLLGISTAPPCSGASAANPKEPGTPPSG